MMSLGDKGRFKNRSEPNDDSDARKTVGDVFQCKLFLFSEFTMLL